LLACGLIVTAVGCGPDYKSRGVVKGRVTFNKQPLPAGTVTFYGPQGGMTGVGQIDAQGNYEVKDAPVGECQVTVTVPQLPMDPSVRARLKGGGPKLPGVKNPDESSPSLPSNPTVPKDIRPIDAKYSKPDTSGLKFTVQKGEQTYNIDL
jgi:hypothetical protein